MSQAQLARELDIPRENICRLINGARSARLHVADALKVESFTKGEVSFKDCIAFWGVPARRGDR